MGNIFFLALCFSNSFGVLLNSSHSKTPAQAPKRTQAAYALLINHQKGALRTHRVAHPELTHRQLTEWAVVAFRLPRAPSRMTTHRALRARDDNALKPAHKTNRTVLCSLLEEEVLQWIRNCEKWWIPLVTGATIQKKADMIREQMLITASPSTAKTLTSLSFSNG